MARIALRSASITRIIPPETTNQEAHDIVKHAISEASRAKSRLYILAGSNPPISQQEQQTLRKEAHDLGVNLSFRHS